MVLVRWLSAGGSSSRKPASLFARLRVPGCSARVTGRSGGQPQRSGEKREEPLKFFEQPSKYHRSSIVTSRLHHANRTLAAGWVLAGSARAARGLRASLIGWRMSCRYGGCVEASLAACSPEACELLVVLELFVRWCMSQLDCASASIHAIDPCIVYENPFFIPASSLKPSPHPGLAARGGGSPGHHLARPISGPGARLYAALCGGRHRGGDCRLQDFRQVHSRPSQQGNSGAPQRRGGHHRGCGDPWGVHHYRRCNAGLKASSARETKPEHTPGADRRPVRRRAHRLRT